MTTLQSAYQSANRIANNQFFGCQHSCQNTCREKYLVPLVEPPEAVFHHSPPHSAAQSSVPIPVIPVMQSSDPVPVVQSSHPVPVLQSGDPEPGLHSSGFAPIEHSTSLVPVLHTSNSSAVEQSSNPALQSSDALSMMQKSNLSPKMLYVPYEQQSGVCTEECMPFCQRQCKQESSPISLLQPSAPTILAPKAARWYPRIIPSREGVLYNVPRRNEAACISVCMPLCQEECIKETLSPEGAYWTPSTSTALAVVDQSEQLFLIELEPVSLNLSRSLQQHSECFSVCQKKCVQHCIQQGNLANQCTEFCNYSCENNCVQQPQALVQQQAPVQKLQQPKDQYLASIIQQTEQEPAVEVPLEETLQIPVPQQKLLNCSLKSDVAQCVCPVGYQYCRSGSDRGCCQRK